MWKGKQPSSLHFLKKKKNACAKWLWRPGTSCQLRSTDAHVGTHRLRNIQALASLSQGLGGTRLSAVPLPCRYTVLSITICVRNSWWNFPLLHLLSAPNYCRTEWGRLEYFWLSEGTIDSFHLALMTVLNISCLSLCLRTHCLLSLSNHCDPSCKIFQVSNDA